MIYEKENSIKKPTVSAILRIKIARAAYYPVGVHVKFELFVDT
jgi:hypothetical protein